MALIAERLSRRTDQERIAFLLEAARRFGSTLDEQRIYAAMRHLVTEAMPLDGLIVSSFDPITELIYCEHIWSDGEVLDCSGFPPVQWKSDGRGMQSNVILSGIAEIFDVSHKVSEPNTHYVQVTPEGGAEEVSDEPATKSAMMAPLTLEGQVTGVVQAMSDQANAYSKEDLEVFEGLALLMTPAWHHARTYERATRERRITDRILDTSPDIVYVFDLRSLKIDFSNGQLERLLGYTEADVAAMKETTLFEVMHPEDVARMPELLSRYDTASDNDLLEAEWRVSAKSGEWRWFLNRARVFERDAEGKAAKILGFATDITLKKEAEARHRETEDRYRYLAENGMCMVWTASPQGVVDYVNARWAEYFGAGLYGATRDDRKMAIHPDEREAISRSWREAVREGREYECETRLQRADGEYRWHLCRATPIKDAEGRPIQYLGLSIDIQDQKEAEEELSRRVAQRTAELEAAVKELEGFTYSVSHDLRGPLRAISAASMILREDFGDTLPPDARHHLLRQAEAAKRMGTLIDDLLKLSRIGRQELSLTTFDLSEVSRQVAQELGVTERVEVQPAMKAHGDPRLMNFVLLNLVENAIKFSPDGATVKIGSDGDAFFVADQGIGFDMQYASKLFRPFERLVREDEYPGTGIGLANAHRIVQRHGGKLWAESNPGEGSTFYFTLPSM